MSTVRTDLLTDRTGVKHPAVLKADFVKAWVLIGGVTVPASVLLGFAVTSVGDGGVGLYTVNLTSPLVAYSVFTVSGNTPVTYPTSHGATAPSVAATTLAAAPADGNIDVHVCGNLA